MCWLCSRNLNRLRAGYCTYEDGAGIIYLCKEHLDGWLDNADEDEELEPKRIEFIDGPYYGKVLVNASI